jgi:uncharacterized membrane protein
MDQVNYLHLTSRWFHLGSIIVLVGGAVFMRFVLMPAAVDLSDAEHNSFRNRILNIWKKFVHPLVALILISGVFNIVFKVKETIPTWHMLLGLKILLAMFVLFIASVLVGRSKALEPIRRDGAKWLVINIAVAAVIIIISGIMSKLPLKAVPAAAPPAATATE